MKQLIITFGLVTVLAAQTDNKPATFAAADVHVSAPGQPLVTSGFQPASRFVVGGAPMLRLIAPASQKDPDMIVGGPAWLNTNKFDVIASAPAVVSPALLQEMLPTLLALRFQLQTRPDTRDMPAFVLTVSKA